MKEWTVEVYILDQDGKEHQAKCFTKVTYNLHPSFEDPVQSKSIRLRSLHPQANVLNLTPPSSSQLSPSLRSSAPTRVGVSSR